MIQFLAYNLSLLWQISSLFGVKLFLCSFIISKCNGFFPLFYLFQQNMKGLHHNRELDPNEIRRPGECSGRRAHSPWNHTYTEITVNAPLPIEDPVYEEIEREREKAQVSDMSDEDGRRQSDMSRQSSRSYGDHRPLIPYSPSPAADRNFHSALDAAFQQRLKEQSAKTVAVLDGQRVVCHLQPTYMPRIVYPPYSEC